MSDWTPLGSFGVDSGQFWIGDPMWIEKTHDFPRDFKRPTEPCNEGIIGSAGLGDGRYFAQGRFVDVGGGDMRLAELRVVFVTDEDITQWQEADR